MNKTYKVQAIAEINYRNFDKCKNLIRANKNRDEIGNLHPGDTFELENEEDYKYLAGENAINLKAVELIEISIHKEENKEKPIKSTKSKTKVSKNTEKI